MSCAAAPVSFCAAAPFARRGPAGPFEPCPRQKCHVKRQFPCHASKRLVQPASPLEKTSVFRAFPKPSARPAARRPGRGLRRPGRYICNGILLYIIRLACLCRRPGQACLLRGVLPIVSPHPVPCQEKAAVAPANPLSGAFWSAPSFWALTSLRCVFAD